MLALSKGPNRVGVSPPYLRVETDPVSETFCFLVSKSENPVILSMIHHHQNPLELLVLSDCEVLAELRFCHLDILHENK
jgi:hypothetical protein